MAYGSGLCYFGRGHTNHRQWTEPSHKERNCLTSILHEEGKTLTLVNLLGDISKSIKNQVMRFLKNTGLFCRI